MVNMNTLFKKGCLLAGVMMAANMFVVNEVKASEVPSGPQIPQGNVENEKQVDLNKKEEKKKKEAEEKLKKSNERGVLDKVLSLENTINLVGGALFTLANSFYKFYENKPGFYFDYYFAGWNSNPFAKGYLQFCPNINLGRGAFWLIATFWGSYEYLKGKISIGELKSTAAVIMTSVIKGTWGNGPSGKILFFFLSSLQGFVSMPLTLHFSKFSISISLDSMIWGIVGMILEPKDKKNMEENKEEELKEIVDHTNNKENKDGEELKEQ